MIRTGLPRWFDAIAAAAGLLVLSPVFALLAIAVVIDSGRPFLFCQTRVGRRAIPFRMIKFRTMRNSNTGPQVTARHDDRITRLGRWLRRTKLDELPELFNVLKGDMALVGPRPEVPRYVDREDPRWKVVLQVRPGITDPVTLWLRNEEDLLAGAGRNHEHYYERVLLPRKLEGYAEYLKTRTPRSDVVIILKTLRAVVTPRRKESTLIDR